MMTSRTRSDAVQSQNNLHVHYINATCVHPSLECNMHFDKLSRNMLFQLEALAMRFVNCEPKKLS